MLKMSMKMLMFSTKHFFEEIQKSFNYASIINPDLLSYGQLALV